MNGDGVRRLLAVAVLVVLVALVGLGAVRGWRSRTRRQAALPAPSAVPSGADTSTLRVEGTYVSTTLAGAELDRVTAHGLGPRAAATLAVGPAGVVVDRVGSVPFLVPARDVLGTGVSSGMTGKMAGRPEILLLRWRCGDAELDTGFRPASREHRSALPALADRIAAALAPTPRQEAS